jgi:RNA polymerase sigma-70 factor (ECF subfamily)
VDRYRAGDRNAADELLISASTRLENLARRMLGTLPALRGEVETGDVLQAALLQLLRSLKEIRPDSTRSFFSLAAVHIRRELLDLARSLPVRRRAMRSDPDNLEGSLSDEIEEPADPELDRWVQLHEAVERLPAELREVFGLTLYHGWTQAQIAELLQVSDRQVRRLWADACKRLNELVGGNLPGMVIDGTEQPRGDWTTR